MDRGISESPLKVDLSRKLDDSSKQVIDDSIDLDQVLEDIGHKPLGEGLKGSLSNPSELNSIQTTTLNYNSKQNLLNNSKSD